ncbi:HAMP domain-containing protein [Halieaceae bacterium IMCC14734]|uniref:HAMP domain-containing protein n=1 Tax=Candidatus Litorirhabdus singularis TaxID=2518993 RepID=A0ABT3TI89_9GAMM|nr:HD domain-containing phosphohydrolase [Candidatus Litorirhabdus singularis]MCX2981930.1 HAMP domain-containing protein [Candidatus Litorirhabdus singularis]
MRRYYPLRVQLSLVIVALIVVVGVAVTWSNQQTVSALLLDKAVGDFDAAGEALRLDYRSRYGAVDSSLTALSYSPLTAAQTLQERLQYAGQLAEILLAQRGISALQVGYADDDYFVIRLVGIPGEEDARLREQRGFFAAPDSASYVVDSISRGSSGTLLRERLFLDHTLAVLKREPAQPDPYLASSRPWYLAARADPGKNAHTDPYWFYFLQTQGFTLSRSSPDGAAVVAADVPLFQLSDTLASNPLTPSASSALYLEDGRVIAYSGYRRLQAVVGDDNAEMPDIGQLRDAPFQVIASQFTPGQSWYSFEHEGQDWYGSLVKVGLHDGLEPTLVVAAPASELLSLALALRQRDVVVTALMIVIALVIGWSVARSVARPLVDLATYAERITRFDFDTPHQSDSNIREVHQLIQTMNQMQVTISRFLGLIQSMAAEQDFERLLQKVSDEIHSVSQSDAVALLLLDKDRTALEISGLSGIDDPLARGAIMASRLTLDAENLLVQAWRSDSNQSLLVQPDTPGLGALCETLGAEQIDILTLPLRGRRGDTTGLLCVVNRVDQAAEVVDQHAPDKFSFLQALSGFASVTIESRQLLQSQKDLLDSFIRVIADAIDAKSPYTGGHCQRVPELTFMLAEAACAADDPIFGDFALSSEQWEELRIAGWMHDCGKVTTPEYVVDKATKLETIYDRIHEIRTRFEVLKRDAEIDYWQGRVSGQDEAALKHTLDAQWAELDAEFEHVAQCNIGGEFLDDESLQRLQKIAARTWRRTLDDELGISWEERQRREGSDPVSLPVQESLLADKPQHIFARTDSDLHAPDNPWGFKVEAPEHRYNRGEIYNLSVKRGTLTPEERFQINDHMVQTIIMLAQLPFPEHLQNVPDIAGGHHEKMDGTGYPRKLLRDDMPLTARMMAIADIFEALTARDRPYKKPKTLANSLQIMAGMAADSHIDVELFRLFVQSGTALRYAEQFLLPEQIDEVDVKAVLAAAG